MPCGYSLNSIILFKICNVMLRGFFMSKARHEEPQLIECQEIWSIMWNEREVEISMWTWCKKSTRTYQNDTQVDLWVYLDLTLGICPTWTGWTIKLMYNKHYCWLNRSYPRLLIQVQAKIIPRNIEFNPKECHPDLINKEPLTTCFSSQPHHKDLYKEMNSVLNIRSISNFYHFF